MKTVHARITGRGELQHHEHAMEERDMNSLERVDTSSQDQDHVLGRKIDMVEPEEKRL